MGHHDLFFKQTFSIREHAVDFVKHTFPPELARGIDFATLFLEKDSHVDATLSEYFSDTIYTCQFSGIKIKIALLFEHNRLFLILNLFFLTFLPIPTTPLKRAYLNWPRCGFRC